MTECLRRKRLRLSRMASGRIMDAHRAAARAMAAWSVGLSRLSGGCVAPHHAGQTSSIPCPETPRSQFHKQTRYSLGLPSGEVPRGVQGGRCAGSPCQRLRISDKSHSPEARAGERVPVVPSRAPWAVESGAGLAWTDARPEARRARTVMRRDRLPLLKGGVA